MALPSLHEEESDLDLMAVSTIALGGEGSSEEKTNRARAALLRATCEHLVITIAAYGSPFGGLQHTGAFIVLPFSHLC